VLHDDEGAVGGVEKKYCDCCDVDARVHHFGPDTFCLYASETHKDSLMLRYVRRVGPGKYTLHEADGTLLEEGGYFSWLDLVPELDHDRARRRRVMASRK